MFEDRWKKFREGIQIFRNGSSNRGCKGKKVSGMSQEHLGGQYGQRSVYHVATKPEKQGVRMWRALETFIGISDFVLSATFIGVLLLEIELLSRSYLGTQEGSAGKKNLMYKLYSTS